MNIPNWFTWVYFVFVSVLIIILLVRMVYIIKKPVFAKGRILSSEEINEITENISECRREVAETCNQVNLSRDEIVKVFGGTSKVDVRKERRREQYMIQYSYNEPFGKGKNPTRMQVKYSPEDEYLEFGFEGVHDPENYIDYFNAAVREYHHRPDVTKVSKEFDWLTRSGRFAS